MAPKLGAIAHVVVLFMENRPFDHIFGCSGIPGIDGVGDASWNYWYRTLLC